MDTSSATTSSDLLATVKEDLLHSKVTALRMLIVTIVCVVIVAGVSLIPSSTIAAFLDGAAILIGLLAAVIFLIQAAKILLRGRSTLEIRQKGFVWTRHGSMLVRPKTWTEDWRQVSTYQHIATHETAVMRKQIKTAVDPRELAGGLVLYAIFGGLPERHALWLGLRDGRRLRLSELSGEVDRLDEVVTQINPGTVIRMGQGSYKFQV